MNDLSAYIPEMIEMIRILFEKGFAYKSEDGSVYFSIAKFKDYGKLSGIKQEELEAGSRIEINDQKKHPMDLELS